MNLYTFNGLGKSLLYYESLIQCIMIFPTTTTFEFAVRIQMPKIVENWY